MTQLIVDEKIEDEWEQYAGEITMTDDAEGRVYIEFGEHEIGINLSDLLKFISDQMWKGASP